MSASTPITLFPPDQRSYLVQPATNFDGFQHPAEISHMVVGERPNPHDARFSKQLVTVPVEFFSTVPGKPNQALPPGAGEFTKPLTRVNLLA